MKYGFREVRKSQGGFTIIELLIATAIFSVIVLIATSVIIRIGQQYYKGVTVAKTQEVNRNIMEEMTRVVQFSSADISVETPVNPGDPDYPTRVFCIGDTRYFYSLGTQFKAPYSTAQSDLGREGLVAQRLNSGFSCQTCLNSNASCAGSTQQLLAENMRLQQFSVVKIANSDAWSISVAVAYGDADLMSNYSAGRFTDITNARCLTGVSGSSFCATSRLDTIVKRRVQ